MDFTVLDDYFNLLDVQHIPFTSKGSRLSLLLDKRGICLKVTDRLRSQDLAKRMGYALPPLIEDLCFFDSDGERQSYTIESYPHCLIFDTPIGKFFFTYEDAENIIIFPPASSCGIGGIIHFPDVVMDRRGGVATGHGEDRTRLVYSTNRKMVTHEVKRRPEGGWSFRLIFEEDEGGGVLLHVSTRLGLARYINDPKIVLNRAAQSWLDWFSRIPKISDFDPSYQIAWWILRAGLVSTRYFLSREVLVSSKKHSTTIWQWDACYYALAYRHIDRKLAQDQIRIFLDHQAPNGHIPDGIYEGGVIPKRDQPAEVDWSRPPLLAWASWKLFERDGDKEFLNEIYDGLTRWLKWWLNLLNMDIDAQSSFTHSIFAEDMDDPAVVEELGGSLSPEMKVFLYLQLDCMAKIAAAIGEKGDETFWTQESKRVLSRIQMEEEDRKEGLFWIQQQGKPVCVPTPLSLLDLITGNCEAQNTKQLIGHLTDEDGVWKNFPLPTIQMVNEDIEAQRLWHSPEWLSVYYLLLEGLDRCGFAETANLLCSRILETVKSRFPEDRSAAALIQGKIVHAPVYAWTAALYIELAVRAEQVKAFKHSI